MRRGTGMRSAVAMVLVLGLAGCATSGRRMQTDRLTEIHEGITTEREVLALLGTPQTKTLDSSGNTLLLYYYTKAKTRASTMIPVVGLFTGGMDLENQMLTVLVNRDGLVEKYTLNDSTTPINTGILNTR